MKKTSILVCALSLFVAAAAWADQGTEGKSKESAADKTFIKKATLGNLYEVQASKLAQQKATSDEVRKFASRVVDDHTKVNDQLMQIANQKNIIPPTQLDKGLQRDIDKLEKASGADFDRQYLSLMAKDHKTNYKQFQKEAKSGKDPDLKAFAAKTLPSLREHMQMAKDLQSKESGSSTDKPMKHHKSGSSGEGGQGGY